MTRRHRSKRPITSEALGRQVKAEQAVVDSVLVNTKPELEALMTSFKFPQQMSVADKNEIREILGRIYAQLSPDGRLTCSDETTIQRVVTALSRRVSPLGEEEIAEVRTQVEPLIRSMLGYMRLGQELLALRGEELLILRQERKQLQVMRAARELLRRQDDLAAQASRVVENLARVLTQVNDRLGPMRSHMVVAS